MYNNKRPCSLVLQDAVVPFFYRQFLLFREKLSKKRKNVRDFAAVRAINHVFFWNNKSIDFHIDVSMVIVVAETACQNVVSTRAGEMYTKVHAQCSFEIQCRNRTIYCSWYNCILLGSPLLIFACNGHSSSLIKMEYSGCINKCSTSQVSGKNWDDIRMSLLYFFRSLSENKYMQLHKKM